MDTHLVALWAAHLVGNLVLWWAGLKAAWLVVMTAVKSVMSVCMLDAHLDLLWAEYLAVYLVVLLVELMAALLVAMKAAYLVAYLVARLVEYLAAQLADY